MLLVFQFPVADTRPFGRSLNDRLAVPEWPSPSTDPAEYVRFFGKAVERRRGADNAWTDELTFCLARRALRFHMLADQTLGPADAAFKPALVFRRLFCDGRTVVRLEIGLAHSRYRGRRPAPRDAGAMLQIAADAASLPTWVPPARDPERVWKPLLRQGRNIAQLYERASTKKSNGDAGDADTRTVFAGHPLLLIETLGRHTIDLPPSFTAVDPAHAKGAVLHFGRLKTAAGVVNTWVVQAGRAERSVLRSLRLCLMRLHAEHECLDAVLHQIQLHRLPESVPDGAHNPYVYELNRYLNVATRLVKRPPASSAISQSAILAAYDAADTVTPVANKSLLAGRFDGALRQVWQKTEDYQARRAATRVVDVVTVEKGATYVEKSIVANVSGQGNIVNIAEYMSNVTNTVTQNLKQSTAPNEVQELVQQLTAQINAVSTKVDPRTTEKLGDNLEALSKQVAKTEPDREWYSVSLKGLKEAAQAVGELGKPILDTLKALSPLLLGA